MNFIHHGFAICGPPHGLFGRGRLALDQKIQEERLRIAESLVRALREAGYSCELADDAPLLVIKE
jgi:hypothetical protein